MKNIKKLILALLLFTLTTPHFAYMMEGEKPFHNSARQKRNHSEAFGSKVGPDNEAGPANDTMEQEQEETDECGEGEAEPTPPAKRPRTRLTFNSLFRNAHEILSSCAARLTNYFFPPDYLSQLPDQVLLTIIFPSLISEFDLNNFFINILHAIRTLTKLRTINRRFRDLLTPENIGIMFANTGDQIKAITSDDQRGWTILHTTIAPSVINQYCRNQPHLVIPIVIQIIIKSGFSINAVNVNHKTLLNLLVEQMDEIHAINIIQTLLQNGANPNIQCIHLTTPLIWAVVHKKINIVRLLLQNRANPNEQTLQPLEWALHPGWGISQEIITLLIQHGAHVDARQRERLQETGFDLNTIPINQRIGW